MNRIFGSFKHAFNGIADVLLHCTNMRIHIVAAILAISLSFFLHINTIEWCLILICIFLVIAAEIFNSALEYAIDLITKDKHDLAKKAKDAAAGAVLVLSFLSLIVGAIIFIPKILILV